MFCLNTWKKITEKGYNFYEFIHELSETVKYYDDNYYRVLKEKEKEKEKEIEGYFQREKREKREKREETLEKTYQSFRVWL